jgi:hypothetical protein
MDEPVIYHMQPETAQRFAARFERCFDNLAPAIFELIGGVAPDGAEP